MEGLTVEEVIELLKRHNPKKRVVIKLMGFLTSNIKEIKETTVSDSNGAESVIFLDPTERLLIHQEEK